MGRTQVVPWERAGWRVTEGPTGPAPACVRPWDADACRVAQRAGHTVSRGRDGHINTCAGLLLPRRSLSFPTNSKVT